MNSDLARLDAGRRGAASACLASAATSRREANESSWALNAGRTAPPWVRRARPRRSSPSRSRRAVIDETPNCASSSATVTDPVTRRRSTIAARRASAKSPRGSDVFDLMLSPPQTNTKHQNRTPWSCQAPRTNTSRTVRAIARARSCAGGERSGEDADEPRSRSRAAARARRVRPTLRARGPAGIVPARDRRRRGGRGPARAARRRRAGEHAHRATACRRRTTCASRARRRPRCARRARCPRRSPSSAASSGSASTTTRWRRSRSATTSSRPACATSRPRSRAGSTRRRPSPRPRTSPPGRGSASSRPAGSAACTAAPRESWDESADLTTLARTAIVVVCAGVKSILDVDGDARAPRDPQRHGRGLPDRCLPRLLPQRLRAPGDLAGRVRGRGRRGDARAGRPRPRRPRDRGRQPAPARRAARPGAARPRAAREPRGGRRRRGRRAAT